MILDYTDPRHHKHCGQPTPILSALWSHCCPMAATSLREESGKGSFRTEAALRGSKLTVIVSLYEDWSWMESIVSLYYLSSACPSPPHPPLQTVHALSGGKRFYFTTGVSGLVRVLFLLIWGPAMQLRWP